MHLHYLQVDSDEGGRQSKMAANSKPMCKGANLIIYPYRYSHSLGHGKYIPNKWMIISESQNDYLAAT